MIKTIIHHEGNVIPFYCKHEHHLFRHINLWKHFYELDLLEAIKRNVGDGAVGIDVGANVGNHSLYFALFCKMVYAFEPQLDLIDVFNKNLERYDNVLLRWCALSDSTGVGDMIYPDGRDSDHTAELEAYGGHIPIKRLDQFELEPDFIKIDVEGHELGVLRGSIETIDKHSPEMFIECRDDQAKKEIFDFMENLDYMPVTYYAFTPVWHFTRR